MKMVFYDNQKNYAFLPPPARNKSFNHILIDGKFVGFLITVQNVRQFDSV